MDMDNWTQEEWDTWVENLEDVTEEVASLNIEGLLSKTKYQGPKDSFDGDHRTHEEISQSRRFLEALKDEEKWF